MQCTVIISKNFGSSGGAGAPPRPPLPPPLFLIIVAKIVKMFVSEDLLFHKRSCLLKNKNKIKDHASATNIVILLYFIEFYSFNIDYSLSKKVIFFLFFICLK